MIETSVYLKNFCVFDSVPPEKIDEVAGDTHMSDYAKGEVVYKEGDKTNNIFLLKQGEVVLYRYQNNKKIVIDTLGPGSIFGAISLGKDPIDHFASAALGSKICAFSQEVMMKIIANNPKAMLEFWQLVSKRLNSCGDQIMKSHLSAEEVLLKEFHHLIDIRGKTFFGFVKRPLVITHQELADRTGLNRVTVTKTIKKLKDMNKIIIDDKTGAIEIGSEK